MPTVYLEATNGLRLPLLLTEDLDADAVELLAATIGALASEAPAVAVTVIDNEMGAAGGPVFESPELQAVHEVVEWAVTDAGLPIADHIQFDQQAHGRRIEPGRSVLFTILAVKAGDLIGRFQLGSPSPEELASTATLLGFDDDTVEVADLVDAAVAAEQIRSGRRSRVSRPDAVLVVEALADDVEPSDLTLMTINGLGMFGKVARNSLTREDMPQIPGNRLDAFREFLAERGVLATEASVDPVTLSATQNQLDGRKTGKFLRSVRTGAMNGVPLWVSADGHLLDGHHRWAAEAILSAGEAPSTVDVIVVDLPISRLLDLAWAFNESEGIESKRHGMATEEFHAVHDQKSHGNRDGVSNGEGMTNNQLRNMSKWANGRVQTMPKAEAEPLVKRGLITRTDKKPPGVNVGNSPRWESTEDGDQLAKRIALDPDSRGTKYVVNAAAPPSPAAGKRIKFGSKEYEVVEETETLWKVRSGDRLMGIPKKASTELATEEFHAQHNQKDHGNRKTIAKHQIQASDIAVGDEIEVPRYAGHAQRGVVARNLMTVQKIERSGSRKNRYAVTGDTGKREPETWRFDASDKVIWWEQLSPPEDDEEFRFRRDQPRSPAGTSAGGQWVDDGFVRLPGSPSTPPRTPGLVRGPLIHPEAVEARELAEDRRWRASLRAGSLILPSGEDIRADPSGPLFGKGASSTVAEAADILFGEGGQRTTVPFRSASRRKGEQLYNRDAVDEALSQRVLLRRIDPRALRSTQPMVTREGVEYYLGQKYKQTGRPYADVDQAGNQVPVIYKHPRSGQYLILSGHHRATAALLQGRSLEGIVIENDRTPLVASAATVDSMYRDVTELLAIDEDSAHPVPVAAAVLMITDGMPVVVGSDLDAEAVLVQLGADVEWANRRVRWAAGSGSSDGITSV